MNRDDEFRRRAVEAQQHARRARTADERANWLQLADGWLDLLRERPQTDQDAFDVKTSSPKDSKSLD